MTKIRVFIFLSTLLIVGVAGLFVSYYARGYRFDFKALKFQPNGILVIKSEPDGASVIIDGELKTATNATVSLPPGTYDVEVKREGFFGWYKRLTIQKEIVTSAAISLFKNVPSLSPATLTGALNPVDSEDGARIVFTVPKSGLWTMDTFNLPLGFSNGPKKIADGEFTNTSYEFSPDSRQILLTVSNNIFLISAESLTSQSEWVNVTSKKDSILEEWETERKIKKTSLLKNLPPEVSDVLSRKSSAFVFSPDGQMILYTASGSGTLAENLIKPLPGASTQRQERTIQTDHTYIYDIKEDRNFLIADQPFNGLTDQPAIRWMPSSRHLIAAQEGQVVIVDYDGTNRQVVYSGSYIAPFAFPYINSTKILILTNLGAASSTPNLYTLTVK